MVILGVAVAYVAIALAADRRDGTVARAGELALLRLAERPGGDVDAARGVEALVATLAGGLLGCAITALVVAGIQRGLAASRAECRRVPWASSPRCSPRSPRSR